MVLDSQSLAAANASSAKNVTFEPSAQNIPRKVLLIGTYDPAKTEVVAEVPVRVFSAEDVGNQTGFGFMLHRLAVQAFAGGQGIETWIQPQAEAGGAAASTGDIDWAGTAGVQAGTIYLYIAGIQVQVVLAGGETVEEVSDAVVAAVNAVKELPVTAAKRAVTFETDFSAKTKGPWGDEIDISFNLQTGEELPTGVVAAITSMTGGSGVPTIANALDGLGTGDDANQEFFTDVVHGYGLDTTSIDAISSYVGEGNDFVGLYAKTVGRPFRVLTGDTTAQAAGLTALQVITDARLTDRANGIIAVPGSQNHPSEIAAQAIGHMARINNERAAQHYIGITLIDIFPGDTGDRWTNDYDNRDAAVKSGISPTRVQNGAVLMQNIVTFYRPNDVPSESNGYRSMRNISILQNVIENVRVNFAGEKWQGISIVNDTKNVTNTTDRQKARDVDAVIDDLVALAFSFEAKAWIYTAQFTIDQLKESDAVTLRAGVNGFDNRFRILLSGEGGIIDNVTEFDTSIAVLLA